MENVHRRITSVLPTCTICGVAPENVHHALVHCTLAKALRDQLRQAWILPPEKDFYQPGKRMVSVIVGKITSRNEAKVALPFLAGLAPQK
jgi:hypothetical protein